MPSDPEADERLIVELQGHRDEYLDKILQEYAPGGARVHDVELEHFDEFHAIIWKSTSKDNEAAPLQALEDLKRSSLNSYERMRCAFIVAGLFEHDLEGYAVLFRAQHILVWRAWLLCAARSCVNSFLRYSPTDYRILEVFATHILKSWELLLEYASINPVSCPGTDLHGWRPMSSDMVHRLEMIAEAEDSEG